MEGFVDFMDEDDMALFNAVKKENEAVKKAAKEAAQKASQKQREVKVITPKTAPIKLPVNVRGIGIDLSVPGVEGKDQCSVAELKEELFKLNPALAPGVFVLDYKEEEQTCVIYPRLKNPVIDGRPIPNGTYQVYLNGVLLFEFDNEPLDDDAKGLNDLKAALAENEPLLAGDDKVSFVFDEDCHVISVVLVENCLNESFDQPITVNAYGESEKEAMTIADSTYQEIKQRLTDFYGVSCLLHKSQDRYYAVPEPKYTTGTENTANKAVEEKYPSDAVVDLYFTRFQLSPADFDGRKEITKAELIRYISAPTRYPGYSASGANVNVTYDKKSNVILVAAGSARKG